MDVYNKRANQQGIPPEEMKAVRVMLKGEEHELEGAKFNLIIVRPTYHFVRPTTSDLE